jgi:hypothetical protein
MAVISMLVLYFSMIKKKCNWFVSFVSVLIISYLMSGAFTARGQIISSTMWMIEIMLIESFLKDKNKLSVIGIFIVSCIVANVHATAWIFTLILFLPYMGEALVEWYTITSVNERQQKRYEKKLAKAKKNNLGEDKISFYEAEIEHCKNFKETYKPKEDAKIIIEKNKNERWLFVPFIFAILGACLTPLGLTPFTYYFKSALGNSLSYISEHLPIIPASSLGFFVFSTVVIAVLGFTKSKIKLSDAFLVLGLYLMTLSSRRNLYLLIPLCAPIVVKMIDDFLDENMGYRKGFKEDVQNILDKFVIAFFIVVFGVCVYYFEVNKNNQYIDESLYPVKATEFIKNNLDYENIKLYNEYDYGSYLLMNGIPVFIDSRCDLYTSPFNKGVDVFDDTMDVSSGNISYMEVFEKYGITHAIVRKDSISYSYMMYDENCNQLYEDDNFVVYQYNGDYELTD